MVKKCEKCGCDLDGGGYQGYCNDCYEKIWDDGFESTSNHAYEIGFHELVKKLSQECNNEARNAMREIIGEWGPLEWKCSNCKAVKITQEESRNLPIKEKIEKLCDPCPTCAAKGHVTPTPPRKFFH